MKFSINQSEFSRALSIVIKGTSSTSALSILAGIYIQAKDNQILLQSSDLELSIKMTVPALIEEEGQTVAPAKPLLEMVKALPDMSVNVSLQNSILVINCDNTTFSLNTLNANDFPAFPEIQVDQEASFPFPIFASMVKSTSRLVAKDNSRPVLTGVLISQEEDTLKIVATDSYRLGVAEAKINPSAVPFEAVVPGVFLQDISTLPRSDENITLALNENQIIVTYQNVTFINRRIEGEYPNYKQLIQTEYSTQVKVATQVLQEAIKRVSLLGSRVSSIQIHISPEDNTMKLFSSSQDVGNAEEVLFCEVSGDPVDIAFNSTFILEGLSAITSTEIYLNFFGEMKPGIMKTIESEDFLYLIMPVRV